MDHSSASRPHITSFSLGLALLAAIGLAACGSSGSDARIDTTTQQSTTTVAADEAMANYASCMRENGVELSMRDGAIVPPGPGSDAGSATDDPDFERAHAECEDLLEGVVVSGTDEEDVLDPAQQEAFLAFAQCMRDHGIDMPDPGRGGLVVDSRHPSLNPDSAEFRTANAKCEHFLEGIQIEPTQGGGD